MLTKHKLSAKDLTFELCLGSTHDFDDHYQSSKNLHLALSMQAKSSASIEDKGRKIRTAGLAIACIIGGASFGLVALTIPFILPALRKYCLPYVPATPLQIEKVLYHVKGRPGKIVDLGSGDGRVVRSY